MNLLIASDHAGFALKNEICAWLRESGHEVEDLGTDSAESTDYPDYGHKLALRVAKSPPSASLLGILVCGTGVGISIAANRHEGVRAVVCSEPFSAKMARMHNDANVLAVGSRVVGSGLAQEIVTAFLSAEFEGGRHARRVGKIELA